MSKLSTNPLDDRVAATYESRDAAEQAEAALSQKLGLHNEAMKIIAPDDSKRAEKLEGKSKIIGKNMLQLHLRNASLGLLIGLIIAYLLVNYGPAATQNSPLFTYIALISPGIFIGTFWAGFRSLKPEHDSLNQDAVAARQKKYWMLLVNTNDTKVPKQAICKELKRTRCINLQTAE